MKIRIKLNRWTSVRDRKLFSKYTFLKFDSMRVTSDDKKIVLVVKLATASGVCVLYLSLTIDFKTSIRNPPLPQFYFHFLFLRDWLNKYHSSHQMFRYPCSSKTSDYTLSSHTLNQTHIIYHPNYPDK